MELSGEDGILCGGESRSFSACYTSTFNVIDTERHEFRLRLPLAEIQPADRGAGQIKSFIVK